MPRYYGTVPYQILLAPTTICLLVPTGPRRFGRGGVVQDDDKTNTVNYSSKASTYSLERWLTQRRKEVPWDLLQFWRDIYCDISSADASLSGVRDV